jgi:hypothetical protein
VNPAQWPRNKERIAALAVAVATAVNRYEQQQEYRCRDEHNGQVTKRATPGSGAPDAQR